METLTVLVVEKYIFAAMMAAALVYFLIAILELKYGGDYEGLKHAKHSAFIGLTSIFFVLVVWGVVHMLLVMAL